MGMSRRIIKQIGVPDSKSLQRLDVVASELFPEFSRARLQAWIRSGELTLDGKQVKPRDKLRGGELINLHADVGETITGPQDIDLDIVYEDEAVLLVNKPAGLVVHPGAGNASGTLMNGLLHYCPDLSGVPRAGIVHRLDKNTTGILVVAKTLESQTALVRQLQERSMTRVYEAVVYGKLTRVGAVNAAIERHPVHRTKMAVRANGREAITHYKVLQLFPEHSHVQLSLETGRTHQIRVHMAHLKFPLVGDPAYGGTYRRPKLGSEDLAEFVKAFPRQALHAHRLTFTHPSSAESISFEAPLPEDFHSLIQLLKTSEEASL